MALQAVDFFYVRRFPKKTPNARRCSLEGAKLDTKRSYDMAFRGEKEAWPGGLDSKQVPNIPGQVLLQVYDLSQTSRSYMRTELADDSLMTIKRNCGTLYSCKHDRCLNSEELFTAMCVPTKPSFATYLKLLVTYYGVFS